MKSLEKIQQILDEANQVVYGQNKMLNSIMAALLCEGHVLIEGMPGLGKTLSVSTMSKLMNLDFKRVQFTPDLLPSDLIGTKIFSQKSEEFSTKLGPVFTNILLADEINRSPAKVQSALLESMAERQVTIGEETFKLKRPFVVLATQNPIEQEGTYPLPEAQLDRFMVKVDVEYPNEEAELQILNFTHEVKELAPLLNDELITQSRDDLNAIHLDEKIKQHIVDIVRGTRPSDKKFNQKYKDFIQHGASPRACIWLYNLSKVSAYFAGRDYVLPDDVMENVVPVIGHRIALSYEAKIEGINPKELIVEMALGLM